MPESAQNAANQDGNNAGGSTSSAGTAFTPIASQDELNRVIADRISRERAKFADYDDLKAQSAKLAEIEQANKSDLEKAQEAAATATATAATAQQETLRLRVAVAKGIPASLVDRLRGVTEQEIEADADELLKIVTPSDSDAAHPGPRPDLTQGHASGGSATDPATEFGSFINTQLSR